MRWHFASLSGTYMYLLRCARSFQAMGSNSGNRRSLCINKHVSRLQHHSYVNAFLSGTIHVVLPSRRQSRGNPNRYCCTAALQETLPRATRKPRLQLRNLSNVRNARHHLRTNACYRNCVRLIWPVKSAPRDFFGSFHLYADVTMGSSHIHALHIT